VGGWGNKRPDAGRKTEEMFQVSPQAYFNTQLIVNNSKNNSI
jgi:hypothetical protein